MPTLLIAVFGLVAGSFLSLCVHRLPLGRSLVRPGSRCPACGHPLGPLENLPLLGFLWLRGRCRACAAAIGWRYPLLELAAAAAFVWSWRRTGGGAEFVREAFFLACLLALAATDLDCRQLPDEFTLGGWAVGLGFAAAAGGAAGGAPQPGLLQAALASFGGAGLLALVGIFAYRRLRGRPGMGAGDVKMMGLLGAFLGLASAYLALLLASLAAAAVGLLLALAVLLGRRRRGRSWRRARASASVYIARGPIPFGVFLAAAAAAALAWGPRLWLALLG
ncbi:MAG TPA: prepilin peptidase [Terriglobales bacterium]|nr:prepilin peptidase [Terriglobales bacterium]